MLKNSEEALQQDIHGLVTRGQQNKNTSEMTEVSVFLNMEL